MIYQIKNNDLEVSISSLGAEPVSVKYKGVERLWQNDNGSWARHAPILFPHGGKCSVVVNGVHYPDQFHGFLRDQEFELVIVTKSAITLLLKSSAESKKTYPFDFLFYASYILKGNTLVIEYRIINPSDEDMYFLLGCHESYALSEDAKNYIVELDNEMQVNLIDEDKGTSTMSKLPNSIDLDSPILDNAGTIVLHNICSRNAVLKHKNGNLIASTSFPDFPNLMLWHPVGAKMICIEPWLNLTDSKEDETKEFKDKEHVIALKPNQEKIIRRTITYFENK